MEGKHFWRMNSKLFPIKAHYFFFYGGMGAVTQFLPVIGKGLGINATAVGLAYTILPFVVLLSKPALGYLTDYFRNIKLILLILVLTSASSVFLLLVPSIHNSSTAFNLECSNDTREVHLRYNESCLVEALRKEIVCKRNDEVCDFRKTDSCDPTCNASTIRVHKNISKMDDKISLVPFLENVNETCRCHFDDYVLLTCMESIRECLTPEEQSLKFIYSTLQFWMFMVFEVLSGTAMASTFCLSDAACCEILGEHSELYGRQRLWGTMSWGLSTLSAGYLNDLATESSTEKNYAPGFYLMLVLGLIDLFILYKVQLTKVNFSKNICRDVGKIFTSWEAIGFATATFISGSLSGLLWSYQFWFLQDIGATQTLLGFAVAVQCLGAEIPFFFFSGWLIKKLGHFNCLTATFLAFTLRYGCYYFLTNPWFTLPVECLHGITFGVFYASMTSYASVKAPPGTEATMLGVFGGLYEGLGVAIGSLLGGVGFDKLGSHKTFLAASFISFISTLSFAIMNIIIKILTPVSPRETNFISQ